MIQDTALPIQSPGPTRDETFVVYFDGFIKNTSEGIIRTMLRDEEYWIKRYPLLSMFSDTSQDELYELTMLSMPIELLYELSDEKLSLEEIQSDLSAILPNIILSNSRITTFEFALHKILQEKNAKKCYIFRDFDFYDNEIEYIKTMYADVLDKIEMISGGFVTLFEEKELTTAFITDYHIVTDILIPKFEKDKIYDKIFIILNSWYTVHYDESSGLHAYNEEFAKCLNDLVENNICAMTAMYNFQLNSEENEDMAEANRTGQPVHHLSAEEVDEEIRKLEGE